MFEILFSVKIVSNSLMKSSRLQKISIILASEITRRKHYLLYKPSKKCTQNQSDRAKILFENYPEIEKVYKLYQNLS